MGFFNKLFGKKEKETLTRVCKKPRKDFYKITKAMREKAQ